MEKLTEQELAFISQVLGQVSLTGVDVQRFNINLIDKIAEILNKKK